MLRRAAIALVSTTMKQKIIGVGMLLVLVLILSLLACAGPTSTVAPITPPPASSAFQTAGLSINPAELNPGQELSITAMVTNTGDIEGSYVAELKINDTTEQAMELVVVAGETQTLSFLVSKDTPGIYEVTLGELTGQFEVVEPVTLPQPSNRKIAGPTKPRCCR